MQIGPLAAQTTLLPLALPAPGPTDTFVPSRPVAASPGLNHVLGAASNAQVEQYRFKLPAEVRHAPAVGADGSLYCAHGAGLTILGPDGQETGKHFIRGGSSTTPVVRADGSVLITDKEGLYCVDRTGELLSSHKLGKPGAAPLIGPDGRIYYPEKTGHLHCLDSDFKPLWVYETEPQKRDGGWPAHIGGELSLGADGSVLLSAEGALHVVDRDGNRVRKQFDDVKGRGMSVESGPAFAPDGSILVSRATNRVECYEADGRLRWSTSLAPPDSQAEVGGMANTTPRCHGNVVVVGAAGGELSGVDLVTGERLFQNDLKASMSGNRVQVSSDGTIYAAGQYSSNAHAVDLNGDRLWSFNFPARAERAYMASSGEKVFMVSQEGQVHALRSDTVRQQLSALPPSDDPNRHGIAVSENAVIVGGVRVKRK